MKKQEKRLRLRLEQSPPKKQQLYFVVCKKCKVTGTLRGILYNFLENCTISLEEIF